MAGTLPTRFEHTTPIFRVEDMAVAVRYYVEVLGFREAEWGDEWFTHVGRDGAGLYLARGAQGHAGAWAYVGVDDAEAALEELKARGARIRHGPANFPWALEIQVEDPDGNVLRLGSEPRTDRPYDNFKP